ncbi:multicopper oxidase family protein [Actinoalloteichus hymeniacidonis]|uniref:Multicopper oxidase n=1 Tax=Actinoalloteichus hymeniacidonis TaxID=340345 RepID=A0AAC9HPH6_9PSEU|nr:multicopper oxidase domain-containing protein [Actinoalloteichus hymeniacidonis]AOS62979.1 putative multicopper oxidase [Actinoalloteichus hymeniacidonis]MBB5908986.1 spore coat protein A [Actinoalloteichus hymeniacidonis]
MTETVASTGGNAELGLVIDPTLEALSTERRPRTLTKFRDPLRIPPVLRPEGDEIVTVVQQAAWARLHSELPPTRVWTYDGHFPGPTFEVRRGQRVRVAWTNRIEGAFPVTAVDVPLPEPGEPSPSTVPGLSGGTPIKEVTELPPWTVVHLHGAVTAAGNDGWADNGSLPGEAQLCEYLNDQPAMTLWYHDHAMMITRWNVYAGLVGMYLLRDEEEDALNLPSGDQEIPLIIGDRNLDADADGGLTGELVHKTVAARAFSGPFTLVNGAIWPHLDVERRWYRFRVLNAANARTYALSLQDEFGEPVHGAVWQIGTDSGLLPTPLPVPETGLVMAPAERADLLIDFAAFAGRKLRLVNAADPAGNSEVMEFRVGRRRVPDEFRRLPAKISDSYVRLGHDDPGHEHGHRLLVLANGVSGHGELWEMHRLDPEHDHIPEFDGVTVHDGYVQVQGADGEVITYHRMSRVFEDTVNWFVRQDSWEQWDILNLTGPTHPIHVHLVRFQATARSRFDISGFDSALGGTATPVRFLADGQLLPDEHGWKDTIRVASADLVSILAHFTGSTGQYMYHCHLLEHEDMGMMRPFVVAPDQVITLMEQLHGHGGGHHAAARATRMAS